MSATSSALPVVEYVRLTESDIPELVDLERANFPQPWTEKIFAAEISRQSGCFLGAKIGQEIVGFGGLMVVGEEGHINTLVVKDGWRGHKLGMNLVLRLIEVALTQEVSAVTLEVRPSNQAALNIYYRFGLAPVGVRKDYYRDEDGLILWVNDIDEPEYRQRLDTIRAELGQDCGSVANLGKLI